MGISLVTFAGQTVTPQDDALVYEAALKESGFIYGGTVTLQSANVLNVAAGHGAIQGRKFTIESTDVAVALSSSGTLSGRLYIHMDLSDSDTPIQLMTETGNSLTPEVQNTDVNINPGVYEINIATFDIDTSTISNLVNVAPYISKELDKELSTTSANPVVNSAITKALGTPETIGGSASRPYKTGELLLSTGGQLYVATADIAQGNNITTGGNVQTTDGLVSQINNIYDNLMFSNDDVNNIVVLNQAVSYNSSYTTPADGIYLLYTETANNSDSAAFWYLDSGRTIRLFGLFIFTSSNYNNSVLIPLKKGTTIYTRNVSKTSYSVLWYKPI